MVCRCSLLSQEQGDTLRALWAEWRGEKETNSVPETYLRGTSSFLRRKRFSFQADLGNKVPVSRNLQFEALELSSGTKKKKLDRLVHFMAHLTTSGEEEPIRRGTVCHLRFFTALVTFCLFFVACEETRVMEAMRKWTPAVYRDIIISASTIESHDEFRSLKGGCFDTEDHIINWSYSYWTVVYYLLWDFEASLMWSYWNRFIIFL
jgi:hypothetical protein